MKLSDAIEFTLTNRPKWVAAKHRTNHINTSHGLRLMGDVEVETIKALTFNRLQQLALREGREPATVNRICAAVHTVLSELHLNDMLDVVPSYRRMREPDTKRSYFKQEEVELMLRNSHSMKYGRLLHDSMKFSIATGCRQGELLKIKWDLVDWNEDMLLFSKTKAGNDHDLPIPENIRELLNQCYRDREDDELVFPWGCKCTLLDQFKRLKEFSGLPEDERLWHSLRHTTGTWLVEAGVPIRSVMAVLNHRDIKTTLRYSKATMNAKVAALESITF
jgi:integrase